VKGHVSRDGIRRGLGSDQVIMGSLKSSDLIGRGAFCSESGVLGFDDETEFDELVQALHFIRHEKMQRIAEGLVQSVDRADAEPLADFEQALLFEAFGGLTHDAAGDAELRGKLTLRGEKSVAISRCLSADEVGEALADFFNEGRWAVEGRERHTQVIRWSDQ